MSTRATKEALDLLAKYIEDSGPCEHAANICVCGEKQMVDDARAEVEAIEKAAKALELLESIAKDFK